jgi:4-hydroxy 2-oxovalerate aldolase
LKNINFIECTLRDGGYHNLWDFDKSLVNEYLQVCKSLELKNLELGFRFPKSEEWLGEYAYTSESTLESLSLDDDFNIGVMINASDFIDEEQLNTATINYTFPFEASNSRIDFIRIATHIKDLNKSLELGQRLLDKGYKIAINIMQAHNLNKKVINEFSQLSKDLELQSVYFADSLGCMVPGQINKLVTALKNSITFPIGIHAHNNMGLALANTVEAVNSGVEWIDMTMTGMGRGPGNTLTEDALFYFSNLETENKIELVKLLENFFYPLKEKHNWGSSPYYFLAGMNKVHPLYIQDVTKDRDFDVNDKISLIDSLGSVNLENAQISESYSPNFKEKYFNYFSLVNETDNLDSNKFKNENFLIIGAGQSVDRYKVEIEKFIETYKPTVLQLNNHITISEDKLDFRVSCHPHRLSSKLQNSKKIETIFIIPNLNKSVSIGHHNVLHYDIELVKDKFTANKNYCTLPNALALTYALAIASKNNSVKNIYLAGIDGYENSNKKNTELNATLQLYKSVHNLNTLSITPTSLNIESKSIFSFEI